MGRFKAEKQTVREFKWGTITFLDSHRILMEYGFYRVTFHRYYAPRGSYGESWGPFRRRVWKYQTLTPIKVFKIAEKFGVMHETKIKEDYERTIHQL